MAIIQWLYKNKQVRSIWWVAVFFGVLAALTLPVLLLAQKYKWELTAASQALIIVAATWFCQLLRKRPLSEITGKLNRTWIRNFLTGLLLGAALMLLPALCLSFGGFIRWQSGASDLYSLLYAAGLYGTLAIAEEFLFRGYVFQRLIAAVGKWGAQLLMAGYFLLIHMNNPGMTGIAKVLASANIFLASILFGLAFIRTGSLAMPLGGHFMANWVQGALLGFGVSGNVGAGLLRPVFQDAPPWLTGGSFGLEASVPGLRSVVAMIGLLNTWKQKSKVASNTTSGAGSTKKINQTVKKDESVYQNKIWRPRSAPIRRSGNACGKGGTPPGESGGQFRQSRRLAYS